MPDDTFLILAFFAAVGGMAGFALAKEVHWRQLFAATPQTTNSRRTCNAAGIVLLALSFLLCAAADPISMAMLVWPMLNGLAAAAVAALLAVQTGRSSS
jgi:hypothetical protein